MFFALDLQRLLTGCDRGGYYHEHYLRGRPNLCRGIVRTSIKGTPKKGIGRSSSASVTTTTSEPNFYSMVYCYDEHSNNIKTNEESPNPEDLSYLDNLEEAQIKSMSTCETATTNHIEDERDPASIMRHHQDKEYLSLSSMLSHTYNDFATKPCNQSCSHRLVSSGTTLGEQLDTVHSQFLSLTATSEPYLHQSLETGKSTIVQERQQLERSISSPSYSLLPSNIVVTPEPSPQQTRPTFTATVDGAVRSQVHGARLHMEYPNGADGPTEHASHSKGSGISSACDDKHSWYCETMSLASLLETTPPSVKPTAVPPHRKDDSEDNQDWTLPLAFDECFVFDDEDDNSIFGPASVSNGL